MRSRSRRGEIIIICPVQVESSLVAWSQWNFSEQSE